MPSLTDKVEDIGMALVYASVLIGGIAFTFWNSANLTGITGTNLLAWGLILTFGLLGLAFAFISHARHRGKR